jgi:tetratricopeptide repeat protein 21B
MAQLYLSLRGNRRAFARCYEEVVEAMPSVQSWMHLGDAYAGIQEPDKAILAYEKARAMDPNNAELSVKIGRTLVTTHDYQRALRYYRDAVVAEPNQTSLRADLAGLYWRLGDIDKAVQVLREAPVLRRPPGQDELAAALERVQLTTLQAKIFKDAGRTQHAVDCLIQARVYQNGVVSKARNESPEVIAHEKAAAAGICLEIGDHYHALHDTERALHFFTEALKHDEANTTAMLNLARIYLQKGEADNCEMQCNALLRVQPACEEAIVMLADLMFRRGRYDDAAFHFLQLLEKQPDNYSAMVHYVQLLRRSGHLQEAPRVFENAEKAAAPGQRVDPGFSYARGMWHKYSGNTREALTHLNLSRLPRGNPWAQKSLYHMIDLYINPGGQFLWEDTELRAEVEENMRTAERLLVDVEDNEKRQLLQGYIYVATKNKDSVEKAVAIFQELNEARIAAADAAGSSDRIGTPTGGVGSSPSGAFEGGGEGSKSMGDAAAMDRAAERMYAPAVVGLAVAHQILRQSSKARTYLKRLTKPTFNEDEEDDYERGYLLLASIYIENGKYDLAQGLLNKAIASNKSCCRAWELLGLIYEKEQSYKDASDCYERAWTLMGEKDPGVGYKLAFNYLKAKRNVQAVDVCHKVLTAHPTYPKIRKEVLERARLALRP